MQRSLASRSASRGAVRRRASAGVVQCRSLARKNLARAAPLGGWRKAIKSLCPSGGKGATLGGSRRTGQYKTPMSTPVESSGGCYATFSADSAHGAPSRSQILCFLYCRIDRTATAEIETLYNNRGIYQAHENRRVEQPPDSCSTEYSSRTGGIFQMIHAYYLRCHAKRRPHS